MLIIKLVRNVISLFFRFFILCYQAIFSVSAGRQCRFEPTCSHYAIQVLKNYSILKSLWLIARRLLKCSPFSAYKDNWYFDPIPCSACGDDGVKKIKS